MAREDSAASAARLVRSIENYLADHPAAALLEDGRVVFDMRSARYAVSEAHGRCLLQFWSEERNLVRTVVDVEERAQCLRLTTRRMGAARPQALELVTTSDRRTPTARDAARRNYKCLLERALTRRFLDAKVDGLRSAMDLEHSFGPAYVRGRLLKGTAAEAVIGVSEAESAAVADGILTLGILWLDYCRQHGDGRRHFGGLKVIVPAGAWRTTAERMAWMNHAAADFQLFTLDQRSEELEPVDFRDTGNLESRLVHAFSAAAAIERCAPGIERLMELVPAWARERVEVRAGSAAEVGLLLHGLEFARVRHGVAAHSFAREDEVSFGAGANETPLTRENEALCRELCARLFHGRYPDGSHTDPLFRMQPEHWLESRLRAGIAELLPGLARQTCFTRRCLRSQAGTAECSTCSRWTATAGSRSLSSRPTKICICPCRRWTTGSGCAPSMTTGSRAQAAAGQFQRSSARDTFMASRFPRFLRASCWPRPPCASIPPMSRCCAIFRRRWSGS